MYWYSFKEWVLYTKCCRRRAGVSKLNDSKQLVDELKSKAAQQSQLLADKQAEADSALREITVSMQVTLVYHSVIIRNHRQHAGNARISSCH